MGEPSEAELLGSAIHWLRASWIQRHEVRVPVDRLAYDVRWWTRAVRERRRAADVPVLPVVIGDVGTVESRHLWGPEGPDPSECACDACRADTGGDRG